MVTASHTEPRVFGQLLATNVILGRLYSLHLAEHPYRVSVEREVLEELRDSFEEIIGAELDTDARQGFAEILEYYVQLVNKAHPL